VHCLVCQTKYGAGATFYVPLTDRGTLDFESTPVTFAAGDTKLQKDGATAANTSNNPAHEAHGIYALTLTGTELECATAAVTIIDQTGTKLWEDFALIIETYGNASGRHEFDLDASGITVTDLTTAAANIIADHVVKRTISNAIDSSDGDTKGLKSLLGAACLLTCKFDISGNTLTVYEDDGTTVLGSMKMTTDPRAEPIVGRQ
jgi:hypothetical protein